MAHAVQIKCRYFKLIKVRSEVCAGAEAGSDDGTEIFSFGVVTGAITADVSKDVRGCKWRDFPAITAEC